MSGPSSASDLRSTQPQRALLLGQSTWEIGCRGWLHAPLPDASIGNGLLARCRWASRITSLALVACAVGIPVVRHAKNGQIAVPERILNRPRIVRVCD